MGTQIDLPSWRTFAAIRGGHCLTMAGLSPDLWAIGHTTTTAADLQQDGTIPANALGSPPLTVLRDWLKQWEDAGRPAIYTSALNRTGDGWDLRLTQ